MTKKIQALRGMNDVFYPEVLYWQYFEDIAKSIIESYGYNEVRLPVLEQTNLFKRSVGDATDIVEKELYNFTDKNNDQIALRPEGTAGCVRFLIERGLLRSGIQRLWYLGPMFRRDRPQKGRYRQFYHLGIEAYGAATADLDAEIINISNNILKDIDLLEHVHLEINSIGSIDERKIYLEDLIEYFKDNYDLLDEDSKRRLKTNPLRILDSKNPDLKNLIADAPSILDFLTTDSKQQFQDLQQYLTDLKIDFTVNPRLVRGLDYYNNTVFEWVTDSLGAQGTVCAGGRYDNLVQQLGGQATPAIGFSIGLDRIVLLLQEKLNLENKIDCYLIIDQKYYGKFNYFINRLREVAPYLKIVCGVGGGSFKNQFKKANKTNAKFAIVFGEDEFNGNYFNLKSLYKHDDNQQIKFNIAECEQDNFKNLISYISGEEN